MKRCQATRPRLDGLPHQCKRRTWSGTDYCYQHAIASREALVVTPQMLRAVMNDKNDKTAQALWRRLLEVVP